MRRGLSIAWGIIRLLTGSAAAYIAFDLYMDGGIDNAIRVLDAAARLLGG